MGKDCIEIMTANYIWSDLARATNDPTTIDEAIAEGVAQHNGDPNAHLGADEALQSHRAAEIIDHLAESVVNDKLKTNARAYVAIVDPASAADFDTVQAAVEYAIDKGGGTIYLAPGDHYINGVVELPAAINMYAADAESCIVHGDYNTGNYLKIIDDNATGQKRQTFENITFTTAAGAVFSSDNVTMTTAVRQDFYNCIFDGGGQYRYTYGIRTRYFDCTFYCGSNAAVKSDYYQKLYDCRVYRYGTTETPIFAGFHTNGYNECIIDATDTEFNFQGATTAKYFDTTNDFGLYLYKCTVLLWDWENPSCYTFVLFNCQIQGKTNRIYTLRDDGNNGLIAFNQIIAGGTGYVLPTGETVKIIGNYMAGAASRAGKTIGIHLDMGVGQYIEHTNAITAIDLERYQFTQLTPNSSRTLTTGVARAGEYRTLVILTSGTTSYTLTFGTGFKTTGTLSTGTVTAKRHVLVFVSDGEYMLQCSRTTGL